LAWQRAVHKVRNQKLDTYAFLLAWFFALLIPEFLANEGNPHALRAIGTLPVVMIMAVIPFMWIFKKYHSFGHSFRIFLISSMIAIFAFIGIADPIKYFVFFANSPEQHASFQANLSEVSKYINAVPASSEKYIITGSMERLTIKYLNPTLPNTFYIYPGEIDNINPVNPASAVYIFTNQDWNAINGLRDRIHNLNYQEHRNMFGDTFYTLIQN
jgi:hypothetical protein